MNLIQVQEHLKDMPMRAIMEYANGKNPQVPPYLALGELNRRKQMEQSAKTGTPPDGTVKDKLEKELTGQVADLMQAGAAKQAQSNQQLQQSLMGQPQPVPEGTPQPPQPEEPMPEMQQMAAGGLTSLPTRDMFKFASGGGVVAFAEGNVVRDPMTGAVISSDEPSTDDRTLMEKLGIFNPENRRALERGEREAAALKNPPKPEVKKEQQGIAYDPATATRRSDFMQAPPAPASAGGSGIPAAIGMPKAPTFERPDADAYDKKLAAFKQANPGMAGSEFQKLLDKIAQQDEADRARFITQEKGRTRADFWKSLIDAGEATRGQKGIGALLGGFGKSAGASEAAAAERENAQIKMRRDQELGMAKMRAELEAARRAEARGDFEAAFKHKQDAEKIGLDLQQKEFSNKMDIAKLQEQARGNSIQAATAARSPQIIQVAQEIMRQNQGMTFNEASDRAAALIAGGQYQSAAQRQSKAVADALAEKTKMIDQQLSIIKPGSPEEKTLTTQRNKIIERFMADQRLLTGKSGTQDVNTPSTGFGTFQTVNPK